MTKRRRYLISTAIIAACVGIVLCVLAMLPPGPGVTKANFDLIEVGMTWREVEAILGPRSQKVLSDEDWHGECRTLRRHKDGTEIIVQINFGKVIDKTFFPSPSPPETILDKLRRWAGVEQQNAWQRCP